MIWKSDLDNWKPIEQTLGEILPGLKMVTYNYLSKMQNIQNKKEVVNQQILHQESDV